MTQYVWLHIFLGHHFFYFWEISISRIKLQKLSSLFIFIDFFSNSILRCISTSSHHHFLLFSNPSLCFLYFPQLSDIAHKLLVWLSKIIRWSCILINALIFSFLVRNIFNYFLVLIFILITLLFVSFVVYLLFRFSRLQLMEAQVTISLYI